MAHEQDEGYLNWRSLGLGLSHAFCASGYAIWKLAVEELVWDVIHPAHARFMLE